MGPLLAIGMQLLPSLIGVLSGDQSGSAKDKVVKAIQDATGSGDPVQAQNKINSDPAMKAKLQEDLAAIALDATKEQNRAREAEEQINLEFQRLEVDDREREREDDRQRFLSGLQDKRDARAVETTLAEDRSPLAWVTPLMAFALVLMIWYLLHGILNTHDQVVNKDVFNVVLGALVTAFTTVVAYYFGSSMSSFNKDRALRDGRLTTNPKHQADDGSGSPPSTPARGDGTASRPTGSRPNSNDADPSPQKSSSARPPLTGALSLFGQKAPAVMHDLMRDLGVTDAQAAGVLGNIGHECNGFHSLQEIKPVMGGLGGWGWCQWTGPRRQAFDKWASDNNLGLSSDDANYGYLVHELKGSMASSLRMLKQAPTLDAATTVFMHAFENPNAQYAGLPDRLRYANLAFQQYRRG